MRYLLDTNIYVFYIIDSARLSRDVRAILEDPSDHIIISHAITERIPLISSDTRFPFYTKQGLDLIYNC